MEPVKPKRHRWRRRRGPKKISNEEKQVNPEENDPDSDDKEKEIVQKEKPETTSSLNVHAADFIPGRIIMPARTGALRPAVEKPEPKFHESELPLPERAKQLQQEQVAALQRLYRDSFHDETLPRGDVTVTFAMPITDPDFPFDLPTLGLRLTFSPLFPLSGGCHFTITTLDIPENLRQNVEQALNRTAASLAGQPLQIRTTLKWLDRNLETLLVNRPESAIKFVKPKAKPHEMENPEIAVQVTDEKLEMDNKEILSDGEVEELGEKLKEADLTAQPEDDAPSGIEVRLIDPEWQHIALVDCSLLVLQVCCDRCQKGSDVSLIPRTALEKACPHCQTAFSLLFKPRSSFPTQLALGYVDCQGCTPRDLLPSTFIATCDACLPNGSTSESTGLGLNQALFRSVVRGKQILHSCRNCHTRMTFSIQQVAFHSTQFLSYAPTLQKAFDAKQRSIQAAKERRRAAQLQQRQLGIQQGQPLPLYGTCEHYKRSHRWLRFPCCGKVYPCDLCHEQDNADGHEMQWANRMICGYCSTEQPYSQHPCACGAQMTARGSGRFWEGGKGLRDRTRMSNKDEHKYRGLNKTISSKRIKSEF